MTPDRAVESAYEQDLTISVRLADGDETVTVGPQDVGELVPPAGSEGAPAA